MPDRSPNPHHDLEVYYGDIHNHCALSYGHGSFEEAIQNAKLQLDFASVTLHADWPDMPVENESLDYLVQYHRYGFAQASKNWETYLKTVEDENKPGEFLLFPSHEWHSNFYGDHCIYYRHGKNQPIIEAPDLPSLRSQLRRLNTDALLIPHHIGYKQGYRGINWNEFTEEYSPVAEIFSFHGSSEASDGPHPYLHSMGPRHGQSTAQYGWGQGHIFGVVGSTDHHNAFPGSYGSGKMGVWAESLTRSSVWQAIKNRRTYALTGDRIHLEFSLNGQLMGGVCSPDAERVIDVKVIASDTIDTIDLLHNNQVIHRECPLNKPGIEDSYKIYIEFGWGEASVDTQWMINFQILDGEIFDCEPRFRGYDSQGMPSANAYAYTTWEQISQNQVQINTRTRPNPSLHSPATEGMCFEVRGNPQTLIKLDVNGTIHQHTLSEILSGNLTHYLGGFVSPAICIHRAIPKSEYEHNFKFIHHHQGEARDWYYIRVRQKNDQWAWSSPIWVESDIN
jgi:hypothetical protein